MKALPPNVHIVYELIGQSRYSGENHLPPKQVDLSHISLPELQRIFHAGPANLLIEGRRHVNRDKAERLQSLCSESIDTDAYDWEFHACWSDEK